MTANARTTVPTQDDATRVETVEEARRILAEHLVPVGEHDQCRVCGQKGPCPSKVAAQRRLNQDPGGPVLPHRRIPASLSPTLGARPDVSS